MNKNIFGGRVERVDKNYPRVAHRGSKLEDIYCLTEEVLKLKIRIVSKLLFVLYPSFCKMFIISLILIPFSVYIM